MVDLRDKRAREIQDAIGEILMQHWDPIRVNDVPEARGEYDAYVGPVYRILVGSRSEQELIEFSFPNSARHYGRSCRWFHMEPMALTM